MCFFVFNVVPRVQLLDESVLNELFIFTELRREINLQNSFLQNYGENYGRRLAKLQKIAILKYFLHQSSVFFDLVTCSQNYIK